MFLIPFRAKNPPERTPYATIALIAINILVFACTSVYFLHVRESIVRNLALSHETMGQEPWRLLTSMFLHQDLLHLGGNMLFLWVFGSAIEGRMGIGRFLPLYLAAGLMGDLLHDLVIGHSHPEQFSLGASGAIMGIAGAYLFAFPFAHIRVLFGYPSLVFMRVRVMEWQARWVVLYFVAFDLLYGMLMGMDGVGHFAHLGGFGAGFALALALRVKRDSEELSDVQAARTDAGNHLPSLSLHELGTLMEESPDNVEAILAYCRKALTLLDGTGPTHCRRALIDHHRPLLERANPDALASMALALPESVGALPGPFLLRLGGRLESVGSYATAERAYRQILRHYPDASDAEMALLRLGRLKEQTDPDKGAAAAVYAELLRRFPDSPGAQQARLALARTGPPGATFSVDEASPAPTAPLPGGLQPVSRPVAEPQKTPAETPAPANEYPGGLRPMGS